MMMGAAVRDLQLADVTESSRDLVQHAELEVFESLLTGLQEFRQLYALVTRDLRAYARQGKPPFTVTSLSGLRSSSEVSFARLTSGRSLHSRSTSRCLNAVHDAARDALDEGLLGVPSICH